MILVANNVHDNGIYTYVDETADIVIKSSYARAGIDRLERERAGYEWYFRLVELPETARLSLKKNASESYARLTVNRFRGRTGNSYRSLGENRGDLLAAAKLYGNIWPQFLGLGPIHGDFALGNMVFQGSEIVLVDWEHFHPAAAPWGMDLLLLLYGALALTLRERTSLTTADEAAFRAVRRAIASLLKARSDLACSLDAAAAFVSANASIWGGLVQKLPIMHLTAPQRELASRLDQS